MSETERRQSRSPSVLLVEDHTLVREGIRLLIESAPGLHVCGEGDTGSKAIELARSSDPDIILMDIELPDMTGLQATRRIHQVNPSIRVIVVTMHDERGYLEAAILAGAAGYVTKCQRPTQLLKAIHLVLSGKTYFPGLAAERPRSVLDRAETTSNEQPLSVLTPRQLQILGLITDGYGSKEIAARLLVSKRTVDTHRQHIMDKLQIHNSRGLMRYGLRQGLGEIRLSAPAK